MAQLVGTVVGSFLGGPVGAMIGGMIGGAIDRSMLPDQEMSGPRLSDLKVSSSTFGKQIPRHFGTVRTAGEIIYAQDLREVETRTEAEGKGGPSQTSVTYSYFATFAASFGRGEARGMRRLWANGILVWDSTTGEPNPDAIALDMTLYRGTSDQLPDPTMEADKGVGLVPAYRDECYIVFRDFPLERFGNRIPSIDLELTTSGDWGASAFEALGPAVGVAWGSASQTIDGNVVAASRQGATAVLTLFDSFTGEALVSASHSFTLSSSAPILYVAPTNEIWLPSDTLGTGFLVVDATTLAAVRTIPVPDEATLVWGAYYDAHLRRVLVTYGQSVFIGFAMAQYSLDGSVVNSTVPGAELFMGECVPSTQLTGGGAAVAVGTLPGSHFALYWTGAALDSYTIGGGDTPTYDPDLIVGPVDLATIADVGAGGVAWDPLRSRYVLAGASVGTVSDANPPAVVDVTPAGYDLAGGSVRSVRYVGGLDVIEVWTANGMLHVLDADTFELHLRQSTGQTIVEVFGNARVAPGTRFVIGTTTPSNVDIYGTTYASAVRSLCLASGLLESADVDVSELGQRLGGYSIARPGPVRAAIEQLARADFFDGVECDDVIRFPRRGAASVASITLDECGAGRDEAQAVPLKTTRVVEMELPAKLYVTTPDEFTDYQPGTQSAERLAHQAGDDQREEYAIVMTAGQQKRLADARLFDRWASRLRGSIATGRKFLRLVPTDVVELDGVRVRLTSRNDDGGVIAFDFVSDDADVMNQTAAGAQGAFPGQVVGVQVPTTLLVLDLPLLRDADDSPGAYVAAYGLAPHWRGMSLFMSSDGGVSYASQLTLAAPGSGVGVATTALGDWSGANVFDESNTLTVRMHNGAPSGTTRLAVLNGANALAVASSGAWEVIQYRDVTANGDGTYTLRGLLRGRCGSEHACADHAIGDRVVMLSGSTVRPLSLDSSALGLERIYKPVTVGDTLGATAAQFATVEGERLECLAPVHLGGGRNGAGDVLLKWKRRTRVGGAWRAAVDASLGEETEAYEIDVFADNTRTTVVRTIASATQAATYTAAQQTSDFGGPQATVYWAAYQLSATVGRGHAAHGTT